MSLACLAFSVGLDLCNFDGAMQKLGLWGTNQLGNLRMNLPTSHKSSEESEPSSHTDLRLLGTGFLDLSFFNLKLWIFGIGPIKQMLSLLRGFFTEKRLLGHGPSELSARGTRGHLCS